MKKSISVATLSAGILLTLGLILRLRQYFTIRSLWADEAMLALNIINRGFVELLQPLDYNQGAPIGFLWIEKLFHLILGRHELILRLFPCLAGIASLWLFYLLLKQTTQGAGLLFALALFAVNPPLIYYASESKQYIVDVAVALGLLNLAIPVIQHQARERDYLLLGLAGIGAMWLSHPTLFTLAGVGCAILYGHIQTNGIKNLKSTILMGIAWLTNFTLIYSINLQQLSGNSFLTDYWTEAFLPMPPTLNWLAAYLTESVHVQLGIASAPWLVAILILIGWAVCYHEKRPFALTLAFISLFAFGASALQLYPVKGRLALFMLPIGIILLGKALEQAQMFFTHNKRARVISVLALSAYLIYNPFITSLQNFVTPKYFEHIRPYMDYLSASWKEGDTIFVSYWAEPAFRYYAPFYKLEHIAYETSAHEDYADPHKLEKRLNPLIGKKRVWVLFSHVYEDENFNERDFIIAHLDEVGKKIRERRIANTSVFLFLYDLKK